MTMGMSTPPSTLPVSPEGRRYGRRPDLPDARDYKLRLASPLPLPPQVDLSLHLGPVIDQGSLGSCTACAAVGMREFLCAKYQRMSPPPVLSPLFQYYEERVLDGDTGLDNGSTIRTAMWVLNRVGVCAEPNYPYDPAKFAIAPDKTTVLAAGLYKGGAYHLVSGLQSMRECLASGYVFELGFDVYESFESRQVAETGIMPVPDTNRETYFGGHAVLVYGYDDSARMLLVRNSWGEGWGLKGNFQMPYAYAATGHVSDCWIMHLGPPWVSKT